MTQKIIDTGNVAHLHSLGNVILGNVVQTAFYPGHFVGH